MIKKKLIKVLNFAGLEVRWTNRKIPPFNNPRLKAGVIVELIGPSGVGKTTLFDKVKENLGQQWIFRNHLRRLNRLGAKGVDIGDPYYNFASMLMEQKTKGIMALNSPFLKKIQGVNFYTRELANSMVYLNEKVPNWLFSDDGIVHLFKNEIIEFEQKLLDDEEASDLLFKNKNLIHVDADEDYILDNLRKRHIHSQREGNDMLSWMDEDEVYNHARLTRLTNNKVKKIAKTHGASVFGINAADSIDENIIKLKNILDTIVECNSEK
ncbi:hypothetical protein DQ400_16645 [Vreelandella sulfidaeris]|uniref:Uncharacterized protein n=1 Tax=Vreelandella sulfidaeris TaxID=115553 RepID=A0A365TLC8_9GAMM|nr:hypothetical protein [Halomonas sulfidaeris]RBI65882.1 hypothetical protein DQ400_16645 [Halomonas sulfidaeris]